MYKITDNESLDRLANVMPRQSGMSFINVINGKLSHIIDVLNTAVVVLNSRVQVDRLLGKNLMLTAIVPAIAQIKTAKEGFLLVDDYHFGVMRP